MRLSRRASWLLIAFAVWSWIIWVTLIKNIDADPRSWNGDSPTGFLVVHVILAIVSLAMGTAIGWLGWKGLRAHRAAAARQQGDASPHDAARVREPAREPGTTEAARDSERV